MINHKFNVIVIGAGPAGVAAAGSLAGTGISVALLEAGVYAGAENWSGCVYFTETLAEPDCFGPDAVAAAPFERKVERRGTLIHNGLDVVGVELTDSGAFRNCYTVLRPVYDPYFAHLAGSKGAVHIAGTTVTSLIRKNGIVVGVETNRGPLYADVTFLAEGDASHLIRSEQLERVPQPHFLQGVKAVLLLSPDEIERRFKLERDQGAAYEFLIRNPAIAGRTAYLNLGGFLYTNRDSFSIGYVAPLDNVRDYYRGSHDTVYEWMCGLPYIKELIQGARLSSYGTKIIRSGGWRERPILVENGLAVGGAATGLGVDIPFPNFTGPACATGLYFARAVKNILKRGSSFDVKQLTREYLTPLHESVHGRNAEYLSRWPGYFGKSKVLFGRTVDIVCGTLHFLSMRDLEQTGRFLRGHLVSWRGLRELLTDTLQAIGNLRLWKPVLTTVLSPATLWQWIVNLFHMEPPPPDSKLGIILHIAGKRIDAATLPWPAGSLLKRLSPGLGAALKRVYANDGKPAREKFSHAVHSVLRGIRLSDLLVLPAYTLSLFVIALGTAVWDAFRFYVLKTPVDRLLAEPATAYRESQKKIRDLDVVKPSATLEAKLATNTYRVEKESHIRTIWPKSISAHPDMAQAGLWWVCPARVYIYEPPLFSGRGKVTVNFENCIKCESCWRAEPARALWGRQTEHKLIYRPESSAIPVLLAALGKNPPQSPFPTKGRGRPPIAVQEQLWYVSDEVEHSSDAVLKAAAAFRESVGKLPFSADGARMGWPVLLGKRLAERLTGLEAALVNNGRYEHEQMVRSGRKDVELRIFEGRLFHALYCCRRIEERLLSWMPNLVGPPFAQAGNHPSVENSGRAFFSISYDEVSKLFPDRIVKQWEEEPISEEWAGKLHTFLSMHRDHPLETIRALSSVSPALGLIAAHQLSAVMMLTNTGLSVEPGVCAANGDPLEIYETADRDSVRIKGILDFMPAAAAHTLLIVSRGTGYMVPLTAHGIAIRPTPAIGFRAAGIAEITLDCTVKKRALSITGQQQVPVHLFYLSIALGAGDYLCSRIKEHASSRIQFARQMIDTEGRDAIAKLGAVKAMIARTEAWRLLLQILYDLAFHSEFRNGSTLAHHYEPKPNDPHSAFEFGLLCSVLSAKAFGPEYGALGYDSGQVFGGFAYSEDDLLSRFYRDSSLFRFLTPGYGAAAKLNQMIGGQVLDRALPALGFLKTVRGEPLGPLASRLMIIIEKCARVPADADQMLAGEAKALIIGIRALLVSIERELNNGRSREAEAAAAEVLLELAEDAVMKAELSTGRGTVSPAAVFPVEPEGEQARLDFDYESFCKAPAPPHKSGSFLLAAFDRSPRYVPEMQLHDPRLRTRWAGLVDWFKKNCSNKLFDGLPIERYIERIHGLPEEIIQAVKKNKWLATYIPESLDGLGWLKAEYYILNSAGGAFGDASIDLLIMASTSIGTTPILLGLEDELPRVRDELAPLVQDQRKLGEIGSRLARIIGTLSSPNPAWIKKEYEAVMKLIDSRIRHTRVVRYLAGNFLRAFYSAGMAGRLGDFGGFIANLKHAGELFAHLMPDVRAALEELPRRERCHKLFLRYLGHGAISAFALTEPTAGSDSGGVATTAKLLRAKLKQLEDGRYSFYLRDNDEKSVRYLIDSDKIAFIDGGIAYRTPDGQAQPVRYDKYDYRTDQGVRYYVYKGRDCIFHDIGQVRQPDTGPLFEYYALTGAKMWITNGSVATQFCLYAQAPEGVTGFMVDRHSEGLKVGADEKKTGQRGSPTNEISIDSVRVPREAVIGYEGHGQVNALETLNVGRCGLAVVSGALMRKLMQEAAAILPSSGERDKLLGEAAAILFGSESIAYYLVGLFDRPHESVRMASAVAKYLCSEDIHELITLLEYAFGPKGQTEQYLLEKARRDSRILTIYEGTNEVQRFLILKDLIAMADQLPEFGEQQGTEAERSLAALKNRLRKKIKEAASLLGDTCWSDAMLQPALFTLSEIAGEIVRLECIYYRIEWLEARSGMPAHDWRDYVPRMVAAGYRAAARSVARLGFLESKYSSAWENIKKNFDMPEVRAADAALDQYAANPVKSFQPPARLRAGMRVLSVIRPVGDLSPHPRVAGGEIHELVWKIDPSDHGALSQLLGIKSGSTGNVILDVLMPGRPEHDSLIRMTAGVFADGLNRLATAPDAGPGAFLQAVKDLDASHHYDLIVVGADCLNGDSGLGAYLAGSMKMRHYRKETLTIKADGTGLEDIMLPAVISITTGAPETIMNMNAAVESYFSPVRVIEAPAKLSVVASRFDLPVGAAAVTGTITNAVEAAGYLKAFAAAASAAAAPDYAGRIEPGTLKGDNVVWAVLDHQEQKTNVAVLRAARRAAEITGRRAHAVIPAPRNHWPQLLGLAKVNGFIEGYCVDTQNGEISNDGKRELAEAVLKTSRPSLLFAGMKWTDSFAYVAGKTETYGVLCAGATGITQHAPALVLSAPAYEGRLERHSVLEPGGAGFITVNAEADFPAAGKQQELSAVALDFAIKPDWIMPLPPLAPPTLSQADVIIDLGYGIRDKSGLALAEQLKKKLEALGLAPMFGATRKVTQDLKLLPLETQIGQTGIRVNPKIIIALGVSGAPQHIDYIGTRAEILCFNKDSEAPFMKLNQTRKTPRVHPVLGDLFVTAREMIEKLG